MSIVRLTFLGLACAGLSALLVAPGASAVADEPPAPPSAEVPATPEPSIPWVKNWAEAKAQAKKDGKDLFIDFTGSDWCHFCTLLEEEVLQHAEFLDVTTKQFVFVYLDFPRGAERMAAVVDRDLNQKLSESYGVRGYPTIILADAEGLPYGRAGYERGGVAPYLQRLADLRSKGAKVKAMGAAGRKDAAVFKAGFEVLAEESLLNFSGYAWALEHAEKQDADGKLGLKPLVDAERERQKAAAEELGLRALFKGKTEKTIDWGAVKDYLVASKHLEGQILFELSMRIGDWLLKEKDDPAEAKKMYQLPLRNAEVQASDEAKELIESKSKECDAALAAKAAPKEEPAPAPKDAPK